MTDAMPVGERPQLAPPVVETGLFGWMRKNLFSSWGNGLTTVVLALVFGWLLSWFLNWALFTATFSAATGAECRGHGACWALIHEKYRYIFFGSFPYEQHWRPLFAVVAMLAIGRRSNLPLIKGLCVGFIELIRGVPLISLLIMASVMLPLFLPSGMTIDKFLRAQVAVILFAGAYIAEIVRGGLQSLPKGQFEAADAMGLNYVQKTALIVLPQALRVVIPPLINTFIGCFKDTSLVLIIGIFDFLNTANQALADHNAAGFPAEIYLFAAFVYFCFCFSMSRYAKYLEIELNKGTRR